MPRTAPPPSHKPKLILAGVLVLVLAVPWLFLEGLARGRATGSCVSEHLSVFAGAIERDVKSSGGTPITADRLSAVLEGCRNSGAKFLCPETGARFGTGAGDAALLAQGLAVWDAAPHGFVLKFRGVVRTDGSVARMSEGAFQALAKR